MLVNDPKLVDDLQGRIAALKEELKYAVADGRHAVACLAAVANQRNELIEAMKQLYKADTMLRLHVMQSAPKVKGFSSWTAHTDALRVAERALRAAFMGGGGAEQNQQQH